MGKPHFDHFSNGFSHSGVEVIFDLVLSLELEKVGYLRPFVPKIGMLLAESNFFHLSPLGICWHG